MTNPLLTPLNCLRFLKILPEHVVPAVTKALNDCRENVERVVAQGAPYTRENLCQPLAEVDDVLGAYLLPGQPPELGEKIARNCVKRTNKPLPLLSEYSTLGRAT